jgi:isopentenyl diphosphate isomerase/L-lactate dehydrogenase-like FMN-dependent dehydrogenase
MTFREFASLLARPTPRRDPLSRCHSIDDLRERAKPFLPRGLFDFVEGGSGDETTLRRNRRALREFELVPQVLRKPSRLDTRTEIFGCASSLPFALGPTGVAPGLIRSGGELSVARAASAAGIPYTVSPFALETLERIASAATAPLWFQLYPFWDRGWCCELIGRARAAGYRALLLTVDSPVWTGRLRDLRNGFSNPPPRIRPRMLADCVRHPSWSWLNGVPAAIDVLPEVAAAVGGQIEVVFDSGIRSGADIVRALCSGAHACLVARAYLYGLAAGGQRGVELAIRLLADDFKRTLTLLGAQSSRDLDRTFVRRRYSKV